MNIDFISFTSYDTIALAKVFSTACSERGRSLNDNFDPLPKNAMSSVKYYKR
jgi:hypothetical protein